MHDTAAGWSATLDPAKGWESRVDGRWLIGPTVSTAFPSRSRRRRGLRLALVLIADLRANLAGRELGAVHVGVRLARFHGPDQLRDRARLDSLPGGADHVGRGDRPRDGARLRAGRLAAAAAKEGRDAARDEAIAEVDVGEQHR